MLLSCYWSLFNSIVILLKAREAPCEILEGHLRFRLFIIKSFPCKCCLISIIKYLWRSCREVARNLQSTLSQNKPMQNVFGAERHFSLYTQKYHIGPGWLKFWLLPWWNLSSEGVSGGGVLERWLCARRITFCHIEENLCSEQLCSLVCLVCSATKSLEIILLQIESPFRGEKKILYMGWLFSSVNREDVMVYCLLLTAHINPLPCFLN